MQLVKLNLNADQLIGALHTSNADCTYIEAWDDDLRNQIIDDLYFDGNLASMYTAEDAIYGYLCGKLTLKPNQAKVIYGIGESIICLAEDWQ